MAQPRHRDQNQRRETSCTLTPMMRALIELEEAKATESRAPCKKQLLRLILTRHVHSCDPTMVVFFFGFMVNVCLQGAAVRGPCWALWSAGTKTPCRISLSSKRPRERRSNLEKPVQKEEERWVQVEQKQLPLGSELRRVYLQRATDPPRCLQHIGTDLQPHPVRRLPRQKRVT